MVVMVVMVKGVKMDEAYLLFSLFPFPFILRRGVVGKID